MVVQSGSDLNVEQDLAALDVGAVHRVRRSSRLTENPLPDGLDRISDATRNFVVRDAEFSTNLENHFKNCVFGDVMLYQKSRTNLAKAPDLWAAIGPGSKARSQEWLERQGDGTVQNFIITCRQAYQALDAQWAPMIEANAPLWGKEVYPKLSNAFPRGRSRARRDFDSWPVNVDALRLRRMRRRRAALEQTTGNYAYGNVSWANSTSNTGRQTAGGSGGRGGVPGRLPSIGGSVSKSGSQTDALRHATDETRGTDSASTSSSGVRDEHSNGTGASMSDGTYSRSGSFSRASG
ncbi:conjugal transfer protein TraG N-terminal domain-containing protein [Tardiphaga sp.]|uniref:conjugal transfer protein TraG N-terminal domain-containing protein n=1 Tax=Tardiphaga sp. TaxID=1926292 RepID=UPI00352A4232